MKKIREMDDGWSEWQAPTMTRYRMGCCDCGLVHDVQFKVVKRGRNRPDGTWNASTPSERGLQVLMRARRNNRSTAGCRRKR